MIVLPVVSGPWRLSPLDAIFTNHTAFDELCAKFACKVCVATDEDMGFGGEPWPPSEQPSDGGDWETPF